MKPFLLAALALTLSAANGFGQIEGVRAGSAEAEARISDYFGAREKEKADHKRRMEVGKDLFGIDERWTEAVEGPNEQSFRGTIFRKSPEDFKVGDWGCYHFPFIAFQKLSDRQLLAHPQNLSNQMVVLSGLDCSKVYDGTSFILQRPVAITGTQSYTTSRGATKTVLLIECDPKLALEIVEAEAKKQKAKDAAEGFRRWTYDKNKPAMEAKLLELRKGGKVILEDRDGTGTMHEFKKLSKEDQQYVREEIARRNAEKKAMTKVKKPVAK